MEELMAFILSTVITISKLTDFCSKYSMHGSGLKILQVLSRSKNRSYRVAKQIIWTGVIMRICCSI